MGYRRRTLDLELDELLPQVPAIAIDGPKGVGKTATARRRAASKWLLDSPAQREALAADPTLAINADGTVLIDEWQRLPQIWDDIRRSVDDGAPPGQFLLTGSATPGTDTHSGAGRILSLRMRPMALHERGMTHPTVSLAALLDTERPPIEGTSEAAVSEYSDAITASGFPWISTQPDRARRSHLDTYLQRIIDRDLPDYGLAVRRPETLRRWLAAYAAATSTTTSYAKVLDATTAGDGSQPAKTTTIAYRDHLTQLWLLDPLPGWAPSRSPLKRLQQAPKHHLADPALAARLLNLTSRSLTSSSGIHMLGPLFESLATLTARVAAQAAGARIGHLRTHNGDREVDLIIEGPEGQVVAIEVKLAATVTDSDVRHLHWLRDQLPDAVVDLVVITAGKYAYRREDGVAVVPLALLGP